MRAATQDKLGGARDLRLAGCGDLASGALLKLCPASASLCLPDVHRISDGLSLHVTMAPAHALFVLPTLLQAAAGAACKPLSAPG